MDSYSNLRSVIENKICDIYDLAPQVKIVNEVLVINCCCQESKEECLKELYKELEADPELHVIDITKKNVITVGSLVSI